MNPNQLAAEAAHASEPHRFVPHGPDRKCRTCGKPAHASEQQKIVNGPVWTAMMEEQAAHESELTVDQLIKKAQQGSAEGIREEIETMNWKRFAEHSIPKNAEVVAFARSRKCDTGELCGRPIIQVFRRFENGWPEVIGWELFMVIPKHFHWITEVNGI